MNKRMRRRIERSRARCQKAATKSKRGKPQESSPRTEKQAAPTSSQMSAS
jgi:hypothetical protein